MTPELLELIAAGGDVATFAFIWFAYCIDKRMSKIEWQQSSCCVEAG